MSGDNSFGEQFPSNPDPGNPYLATEASARSTVDIELPPGQRPGLVGQVPVLGILTMVHGGLALLLGLGALGMAIFIPAVIDQQMMNNPQFQQPQQQVPFGDMQTFMMVIYGGAGGLLFLLGSLSVFAGYQINRFRGRFFGIGVLSMGLLTLLTCYCFPTSLGLFIYGLIVLLNDSVKLGFELADRGYSSAEIKRAFAQLPIR